MWNYCGIIVELLWNYVELFAKMELWCTQFWTDVYPSQFSEFSRLISDATKHEK